MSKIEESFHMPFSLGVGENVDVDSVELAIDEDNLVFRQGALNKSVIQKHALKTGVLEPDALKHVRQKDMSPFAAPEWGLDLPSLIASAQQGTMLPTGGRFPLLEQRGFVPTLRAPAPCVLAQEPIDPAVLSMMVAQLVMQTGASNLNAISQQLSRSTDLQEFLRKKQVDLYQVQLNKEIDAMSKEQIAAIASVGFDVLFGVIDIWMGTLKVMQGVATGNPLDIAAGAAFIAAGALSLGKATAETAVLLGGNKECCQKIINVLNVMQMGCMSIGVVLDVYQLLRGLAVIKQSVKPLIEKELSLLAEEAPEIIGEIAKGNAEAIKLVAANVENAVANSLPNSRIASDIISTTLNDSLTHASKFGEEIAKDNAKTLISHTIEHFHNEINLLLNKQFNYRLAGQLQSAYLGLTAINRGTVLLFKGMIQRDIDLIGVQQSINDSQDISSKQRKKITQGQLQQNLQNCADVVETSSAMITDNGTVREKIAAGLA